MRNKTTGSNDDAGYDDVLAELTDALEESIEVQNRFSTVLDRLNDENLKLTRFILNHNLSDQYQRFKAATESDDKVKNRKRKIHRKDVSLDERFAVIFGTVKDEVRKEPEIRGKLKDLSCFSTAEYTKIEKSIKEYLDKIINCIPEELEDGKGEDDKSEG